MQDLLHYLTDREKDALYSDFIEAPDDANLEEAHNIFNALAGGSNIDAFAYAWNRATHGEKRSALLYLQEARPDVFDRTKADLSGIDGSKLSSKERGVVLRYLGKLAINSRVTLGRILAIQTIHEKVIKQRQAEMSGVVL